MLDFPAELTTERLHLRRWRPSDAEDYRGLWAERDVRALRRIDADHGVRAGSGCGRPCGGGTRRRFESSKSSASSAATVSTRIQTAARRSG
ncbi:hypothetical protein OHA10_23240 [Kribbella sp. NBC_00662]|uniref:hypothetical protein n=1 Tax=Kribbella sp. NBC_00662 TaxID=2975969 RepID=UPI00324E2A1D